MTKEQLKCIVMALLSQSMSGRPFNELEIKALSQNADTIINKCIPEEVTPVK
jgi:hypothetical protein